MINYFNAQSWPFQQALKLKESLKNSSIEKGYVLFETGYGPSGLPHMGTFGEVFRTTLVRRAFQLIDTTPTRLFAFSDDMDGLRKVPDNVPNREMLQQYIGHPLTSVPDPFEQYESFGHHNNAMLRQFIDRYGFEYEFKSATEEYKSGRFDPTILKVLQHYKEIMDVMLPTLREERRNTYSPILPISPITGKVLYVPLENIDVKKGTVSYRDENGDLQETSAFGGKCKLQWKADWAMRWVALDIDYEMAGRDLGPTFELSAKIAKILGGRAPNNLIYELFVDENNQKISKSKGNGLTIDQWMAYGTPESMGHFIYTKPTSSRKLHLGTIAASTKEYFNNLARYEQQDLQQQIDNPIWHIHNGQPLPSVKGLDFDLIVNLASVVGAEDPAILKAQILRSKGDEVDQSHPLFDALIEKGVRYYVDFIKPNRAHSLPSGPEAIALQEVKDSLEVMSDNLSDEEYQNVFYAVGKKHFGKENLRTWFKRTYEVLFGQADGPRMGGFTGLYGRENTIDLISKGINGELVSLKVNPKTASLKANDNIIR